MRSTGRGLLDGVDVATLSAQFAARLHAAGVPVTAEQAGRFAGALALAPPATVTELRWLGRVTLVGGKTAIEPFERVFAQVFRGLADPADFRGDAATPPATGTQRRPREPGAAPPPAPPRLRAGATPDAASAGEGDESPEPPGRDAVVAARSGDEHLRARDFATLSDAELSRLRHLADALAAAPPPRPARRTRAARTGRQLDVRATLRAARRTGGEPVVTRRRRTRHRPRRIVLICDISGSMEAYARAYLHLLVSGAGAARAEAFVFATRLTRLTRTLRDVAPDRALARAGQRAPDWSGGTRIGAALKSFNDAYGRRGVARGAVVVILSDGWDTGDPEVLGREMARLGRLAFRVVWVNPRKAAAGYEPLAGGMAAALPHVDAFVSGHSYAALDEVVAAIGRR